MYILNNKNIIALIGLLIFSPVVLAAEFDSGDINGCLIAVSKVKEKSNLLKIEQLVYKKQIIYEIEVQDPKGAIWEVACKAEGGGTISHVTQEYNSSSDPKFMEAGGMSEKDARGIALSQFPGTIVETEYERRVPGFSLYEFSILNDHGQDIRVKINATSGVIEEVITEEWELRWK